jgi:phosphoglycerate dehydrogenase-like enzyme
VTRELVAEFPHIAVHNLHHNALPVAEHAIALLLAASKFLMPMDRALREDDWRPRYRPNPSVLLEGKTALVLGYGAVGQRVARLCQGLGMEVRAIRRHGRVQERSESAPVPVYGLEALASLLPEANVLIVCLPHTPETDGLIGADELSRVPSDSVLVNIGRGPIVNESALYEALSDGTLYAAGLDVWYEYPSDEESRSHTRPSAFAFGSLDNVVLSPHRAGGSRDTDRLRMDHLAALLNAIAQGKPVPNRVDLSAGY